MRALIIIASVIVVLFVGSMLTSNYLTDSSSSINNDLQVLDRQVRTGNWNEARDQFSEVKNKWDGIKDGWAMLLDHQEIDNIDLSFSRMEEYVKVSQAADSLAEISSLKLLFEHIPEKESFSLKNIL